MNILIASRSSTAIEAIQRKARGAGMSRVETRLMVNGDTDPCAGAKARIDVLILHSGIDGTQSLGYLASRASSDRPALIVVGEHLDPNAMRLAMQAGARDFIADLDSGELEQALHRVSHEATVREAAGGSRLIAIVNAKGGSGASFIASNLAHLSATVGGDPTLLMDLDLQFGPLPRYLDVKPRRGLSAALERVYELDEVAVGAYVVQHESGLDILAPLVDAPPPAILDAGERMMKLLDVLSGRYANIFADVPRHLDEASTQVLRSAERVVIVLQQSLHAVNDAVRLKNLLVRELGVPQAHVLSVINRHSRRAALELRDVQEALGESAPFLLPNHYQLVSECVELGLPAAERAPGSHLVKALTALQTEVTGVRAYPERRGLLDRLMLRG